MNWRVIYLVMMVLLGAFSCAPLKKNKSQNQPSSVEKPCQSFLGQSGDFNGKHVKDAFRCLLSAKESPSEKRVSTALAKMVDEDFEETARWLNQGFKNKEQFISTLAIFPPRLGEVFANPQNTPFWRVNGADKFIEMMPLLGDLIQESPSNLKLQLSKEEIATVSELVSNLAEVDPQELQVWIQVTRVFLKELEAIPEASWKALLAATEGPGCLANQVHVKSPVGLSLELVRDQGHSPLTFASLWEPYRLWLALCEYREELSPSRVAPFFELLLKGREALAGLYPKGAGRLDYESLLKIIAKTYLNSGSHALTVFLRQSILRPDRFSELLRFVSSVNDKKELFSKVYEYFPDVEVLRHLNKNESTDLRTFFAYAKMGAPLLREWQNWERNIGPELIFVFGKFIRDGGLQQITDFLKFWTATDTSGVSLARVHNLSLPAEDDLPNWSAMDSSFNCQFESTSIARSYLCFAEHAFFMPFKKLLMEEGSLDRVFVHLKSQIGLLKQLIKILRSESDNGSVWSLFFESLGGSKLPLKDWFAYFASLQSTEQDYFYNLASRFYSQWIEVRHFAGLKILSSYQTVLSVSTYDAAVKDPHVRVVRDIFRKGLGGNTEGLLNFIEHLHPLRLTVKLRGVDSKYHMLELKGVEVLDLMLWESKNLDLSEVVVQSLEDVYSVEQVGTFVQESLKKIDRLSVMYRFLPGDVARDKRKSLENLKILISQFKDNALLSHSLVSLAKLLKGFRGETLLTLHELGFLTVLTNFKEVHFVRLKSFAHRWSSGVSPEGMWNEFLNDIKPHELNWFKKNVYASQGQMGMMGLGMWLEVWGLESLDKTGNLKFFIKKSLKELRLSLTKIDLDHQAVWSNAGSKSQDFVSWRVEPMLRNWDVIGVLKAMQEEPSWYKLLEEFGHLEGRKHLMSWARQGSYKRLTDHLSLVEEL